MRVPPAKPWPELQEVPIFGGATGGVSGLSMAVPSAAATVAAASGDEASQAALVALQRQLVGFEAFALHLGCNWGWLVGVAGPGPHPWAVLLHLPLAASSRALLCHHSQRAN